MSRTNLYAIGLSEDARRRFWVLTGSTPLAATEVDRDLRKTAESYVREAARELRVEPPYLRWYKSVNKSNCGWFCPQMDKAIWIRHDVTPAELKTACAHEVAHYADHMRGGDLSERFAKDFAERVKVRDWHTVRRQPHRHLQRV